MQSRLLSQILAFPVPGPAPCDKIHSPHVEGAQVLSVVSAVLQNASFSINPDLGVPAMPSNFSICEVNVTLTHSGKNDKVLVQTWLPLDGWSGRFQGTGGGGLATGIGTPSLGMAAQIGYAASQTDGGHAGGPFDAGWALDTNGQIDYTLLNNFAFRSLHDMTVVGKQVTASFYGRRPRFSYWNGCSTGGRQGHMMAQRYPNDYDGIMANAPAINWDRFVPSENWPQIVMKQSNIYPTACEFAAFENASIAACDELDGVNDGLISNTEACSTHFDPHSLVGVTPACADHPITAAVAEVVQKIHDGPRSTLGVFQWYGLEWATPFTALANSTTLANGSTKGVAFPISAAWIANWQLQNPDADTTAFSYAEWDKLFADSRSHFNSIIGTDNPDLTAFRDHGGKMVIWHGLADPLIMPNGTINYRRRVEEKMGGNAAVNEFYRTFLAPGVGHCGGEAGLLPKDPLSQLVQWVEEGKAPDVLHAETVDRKMSRGLCPWPTVERYVGGDIGDATSYVCAESYYTCK